MTGNGTAIGIALYELAVCESMSQQLLGEISQVCTILNENPLYVKLLSTREIPVYQRMEVVKAAFQSTLHPYVMNVLSILTEKVQIKEIFACQQEFHKRYNLDNNIAEVRVISAVELTDKQRQNLLKKLENLLGKSIIILSEINTDLIGGIKLELPGEQLDGTVKSKLKELRAMLCS